MAKIAQMSFSSSTFTIPSQKTVHLGEEAMRMVLSRMPVLTSLKVKKNIKIIIAKFIFRIIMIIPILWMRIGMILQFLTRKVNTGNFGDLDLNPQGVLMGS